MLKIPAQIKSTQQLIALLVVIASLIWMVGDFSGQEDSGLRVGQRAKTIAIGVQDRIRADSVVFFELAPDGDLVPVWLSAPDYGVAAIVEFYHVRMFSELRQGRCWLEEKGAKGIDRKIKSLLVCPILKNGRLIGAVGGIYEKPLQKNERGEYQPQSSELYRLGTYLH